MITILKQSQTYQMKYLKPYIVIVLVLLGIALLFWLNFQSCETKTDDPLVIPEDTAVVKRGDTSRSQAITASNPDDLLAIQSKDSLIVELQNVIKEYKEELRSATLVKSTIDISGKGKTEIVTDSTKLDSSYVWPTYKTLLGDKWYTANITASRDTTYLGLRIKNEYSVIVGQNKEKKWYADVINHNPHTETNYIRTFQVTPPTLQKQKDSRWSIAGTVAYGVTNQGFQPFVGVGIAYDIIKF